MINETDIDTFFTYLNSQETAQQYLHACYRNLESVNADKKSYENCHSFLSYLEHGKQFYQNGKKMNLVLQPILLFYGMTHLLKAALLTKRPDYPESTKVLAHGVSTRKRKKKNYYFMCDEVKIQHFGLFPYVSEHLFPLNPLPSTKYRMEFLLSLIPEMAPLFKLAQQEKWYSVGKIGEKLLTFPRQLFDQYHLTEKAFLSRIKPYLPPIKHLKEEQGVIQIHLSASIHSSNGPFFLNLHKQEIFFPNKRENFLPISEIMVHYLVLYNLSMICRYETEWWADLLHSRPDKDFPFISHFLKLTAEKIPLLIGNQLLQNTTYEED